jgi:dihydroorotate dehydrogenase
LSAFGAIVTNPVTLRPKPGPGQPRLVETTAGFILNTGQQNPGVKKVIRQYQKTWLHLAAPVIAHLPADEPEDLLRTARALSGLETPKGQPAIVAIELGIPHQAKPSEVLRWVGAVQEGSHLPLLVKLPLNTPPELAEAAADTYTDALVIGLPPLGTAKLPTSQAVVTGFLYGPALHSLTLRNLSSLKNRIDIPLVAAGGIHSLADVQAFLMAGAAAVQIDTLIFIEPQSAYQIALAFRPHPPPAG